MTTGTAWFDDFDLLRLAPQQRRAHIFVNQVGYELDGPKSAVIAANFMPRSGEFHARLETSKGKGAWKKTLRHPRSALLHLPPAAGDRPAE